MFKRKCYNERFEKTIRLNILEYAKLKVKYLLFINQRLRRVFVDFFFFQLNVHKNIIHDQQLISC